MCVYVNISLGKYLYECRIHCIYLYIGLYMTYIFLASYNPMHLFCTNLRLTGKESLEH